MDYLKVIEKKRIKLAPIINRSGKVEFWSAGYRRLGSDGWLNYVSTDGFAHGKTPQEAIDKLLRGDTEYIRVKSGFVERIKKAGKKKRPFHL